jgi:hypothetical protein
MSDLNTMLEMQRQLQVKHYGKDPADLSGEERALFIKDMVLALTDELHEALQEVGWKPWATSRHVNDEAFKGELIDAWHFFMNLILVSGMDPFDFMQRYISKHDKNASRQEAGYDGVADKCPGCRRALDDEAVLCIPAPGTEPLMVYCAQIRRIVTAGVQNR